ncbi:MAG TPA: hypothetical protein DFR83_20285 [Deltaproteobacteria bacterium]|nr:hypothetical protein [Deltaproteobacteria bacterium]
MLHAFLALALTASTASAAPAEQPVARGPAREKKPLLAAGLNWFVPGAGYMYNGRKPALVTVPMMAGAAGLTYIENFHQFDGGTLREIDSTAFAVTFGSVLVLNTGLAIDAYREAKNINEGRNRKASLSPTTFADADGTRYGAELRFAW